jgi:hypothetical protein
MPKIDVDEIVEKVLARIAERIIVKVKETEVDDDFDEDAYEEEVEETDEEGFSEKLAEEIVNESFDPETADKEDRKAIEAWLKVPVKSAEGKKLHKEITALLKRNLPKAYLRWMAQKVGVPSGGSEPEIVEDADVAYIRGKEVFCNGVPLEETDKKNVGKDVASGKLFKITEDGEIEPYKKSRKNAKSRR